MKSRVISFCLLLAGLTTEAYALTSMCLKAPERMNVCPHLIYKRAVLSVVLLNVNKGDVICICLTDFKAFRNTATSKAKQIDQHVSFKKIAEEYQLSEQDILTLIRS